MYVYSIYYGSTSYLPGQLSDSIFRTFLTKLVFVFLSCFYPIADKINQIKHYTYHINGVNFLNIVEWKTKNQTQVPQNSAKYSV